MTVMYVWIMGMDVEHFLMLMRMTVRLNQGHGITVRMLMVFIVGVPVLVSEESMLMPVRMSFS